MSRADAASDTDAPGLDVHAQSDSPYNNAAIVRRTP